jgi:hypothetical protein
MSMNISLKHPNANVRYESKIRASSSLISLIAVVPLTPTSEAISSTIARNSTRGSNVALDHKPANPL